jgi:hypothetical protein
VLQPARRGIPKAGLFRALGLIGFWSIKAKNADIPDTIGDGITIDRDIVLRRRQC